jgi:hypothetical protein
MVPVPGHPTAVLSTANGRWAFASVSTGTRGEIAVMTLDHGAPRLVRTVKLPRTLADAFGMAMTHDGLLLLVAGYTATGVLSVRGLEGGSKDPVVGILADAGAGQFEVAVSRDDRYVFVTDETSGGLSVFNLETALRRGFSADGVAVGIVPLALGAVGVAMFRAAGSYTSLPTAQTAALARKLQFRHHRRVPGTESCMRQPWRCASAA